MNKLYWKSPDLRAYFPMEMQLKGYEAVKEAFIRDFTENKSAKIEYTDTNNIPFADCVIGHGTFRITMPSDRGSPMFFDGRYTEVKVIKDGKMVVILDHVSVPMQPHSEESAQ